MRNRQFIRKIDPLCKIIESKCIVPNVNAENISRKNNVNYEIDTVNMDCELSKVENSNRIETDKQENTQPNTNLESSPSPTRENVRKSTRIKVPRQLISMSMKGKTHEMITV